MKEEGGLGNTSGAVGGRCLGSVTYAEGTRGTGGVPNKELSRERLRRCPGVGRLELLRRRGTGLRNTSSEIDWLSIVQRRSTIDTHFAHADGYPQLSRGYVVASKVLSPD